MAPGPTETLARSLAEAAAQYAAGRYHAMLVPANVAVEAAIYQAVDLGRRWCPKYIESEPLEHSSRCGRGREGGNKRMRLHGRVDSGFNTRVEVRMVNRVRPLLWLRLLVPAAVALACAMTDEVFSAPAAAPPEPLLVTSSIVRLDQGGTLLLDLNVETKDGSATVKNITTVSLKLEGAAAWVRTVLAGLEAQAWAPVRVPFGIGCNIEAEIKERPIVDMPSVLSWKYMPRSKPDSNDQEVVLVAQLNSNLQNAVARASIPKWFSFRVSNGNGIEFRLIEERSSRDIAFPWPSPDLPAAQFPTLRDFIAGRALFLVRRWPGALLAIFKDELRQNGLPENVRDAGFQVVGPGGVESAFFKRVVSGNGAKRDAYLFDSSAVAARSRSESAALRIAFDVRKVLLPNGRDLNLPIASPVAILIVGLGNLGVFQSERPTGDVALPGTVWPPEAAELAIGSIIQVSALCSNEAVPGCGNQPIGALFFQAFQPIRIANGDGGHKLPWSEARSCNVSGWFAYVHRKGFFPGLEMHPNVDIFLAVCVSGPASLSLSSYETRSDHPGLPASARADE